MEVSLFPFGLLSDDLSFSCVTLYNSLYKINVCMQMLKKLSKQLGEDDWNWNNLNTLCWAIGSISGSMGEEQVGIFCILLIYIYGLFCISAQIHP